MIAGRRSFKADKEKSSIEYQVQVEREKKGVAQLPFRSKAWFREINACQSSAAQGGDPTSNSAGGQRPLEKKSFTAEVLRQRDFKRRKAGVVLASRAAYGSSATTFLAQPIRFRRSGCSGRTGLWSVRKDRWRLHLECADPNSIEALSCRSGVTV